MFSIHCHLCGEEHLVGSRHIVSMHHTSEGPVAYVRCLHGHLVVHEFRRRRSVATAERSPLEETATALAS